MTRSKSASRLAAMRDDRIEQEFVILPVEHQHDRLLVNRIAALGADAGLPVLGQEILQPGDLLLEIVRGVAGERDLVPDEAAGRRRRLHRQPRRFGVIHVGEDEHGGGMLEETIRHLLEREPDVLEADLLAGDVERHVRIAVMHRAHHARQHRAVAHAGIEQAHRRRTRMDVGEFERDAVRDHPFLAAGVHEQQIFLPVVEEAEIAGRIGAGLRPTSPDAAPASTRLRSAPAAHALDHHRALALHAGIRAHEGADAVERFGGDAAAIAQAAGQLAVIDRAAAEGGFGQTGLAAIVGDFLQQLLCVHRTPSLCPLAWRKSGEPDLRVAWRKPG